MGIIAYALVGAGVTSFYCLAVQSATGKDPKPIYVVLTFLLWPVVLLSALLLNLFMDKPLPRTDGER